MTLNRQTVMFLATLAIAAGVIIWVIQRTDRRAAAGAEQAGWQHADTPRAEGDPMADPWLAPPDAWLEVIAPVVKTIGTAIAADAGPGAEVLAAADGVVWFAGMRADAHAVVLGHRDDVGTRFESVYAPLAGTTVKAGELVGRGMSIGRLGDTPMGPVFPSLPEGIDHRDGERSPLAEALEAPDPDPWMWLEIENAGKFLDLMETPDE